MNLVLEKIEVLEKPYISFEINFKRRYKKRKDTCMGFVDIEKAFDNNRLDKIFEILKETGIKFKETILF